MSKLNREKILERLALIEEKKKRHLKKKDRYIPNEGQLPVHMSSAQERWCLSANGSGKTTALVNEVHWAATGYNPVTKKSTKVPCKIVVVLDKSDKVGEVFLPEYQKWYELKEEQKQRAGKPYVSRIEYDNGSVVSFYTAEADPMSFEGFMADYVFLDEPIPRPLVIALRRSLRLKNSPSKLTFFGTPISQAWIRKEVYEPWAAGNLPHVECFRMGIKVNEQNLGANYIARFSSGLTEAEKRTRLEGAFFDADSLALAEFFKPEFHIIKKGQFHYDPRMPCVVAVDPHSVKPHTAVMVTIDRDDKAIAVKTMSFRGNATQFAAELRAWEKGFNVVDRVCDSLGSMEMTSGEGMHSFIEGLQANGVMIRATTFKEKNHEDLVDRLRQGLAIPDEPDSFGRRTPMLRFTEDTGPLIANIEQVTWQKNKVTGEFLPKLDTSTKDYLSCLGYALAIGVKYDIIKHSKPSYRTDALPASPDKAEVEAHRKRIKETRRSRTRVRFIRRTLRGLNV